MKKSLRIFFGFLFLLAVIPSCELLEDCKTCKLITNNDGDISEGTGILYCGDKLEEKENSSPTTIGSVTTYWECE
jgi:hypothetical protein